MKYVFSLLAVAVSCASVHAAVTPATWSSFTSTTAVGDLNGITINATSNADAPIVGFMGNSFGSNWDGTQPLGNSAIALVVSNVNAGDMQTFSFSSPLVDGTLFYIENFDSSSIAKVTVNGATSNTLFDASASIGFGSVVPGDIALVTTNSGYNGEGDLAIELTGPVTDIQVEYFGGEGANGIMYTFAAPEQMTNPTDPHAVPEPSSLAIIAGLFGLGGFTYWRKRK